MPLNPFPSSPDPGPAASDGGRLTPARRMVLDILLAAPNAMTHLEVETAARERGLRADRVTLYRALDWLLGRGLAHRIEGSDRVWRFNAVAGEDHGHAHFHCVRCGRVFCLDLPQPEVAPELPPGFHCDSAELTLRGTCDACGGA
jgi:Fur family ferric uptake transcriptional regulator